MKKSLFASLLALGLLASCGAPAESAAGSSTAGGASKPATSSSAHTHNYVADTTKTNTPATCSEAGKTYTKCEICGKEKTETTAKLSHNYVADTTKTNTTPTCGAEGHTYTKCTLCGDQKDEVTPSTAHTFGAETVLVASDASETTTGTKQQECSVCHKKSLIVDAMDYTFMYKTLDSNGKVVGGNKDASGQTLKLAKNGDYVEYNINVPAAMTNAKVYLYGMVDYYHTSDNQNETKSFFPSGDTANFTLKLGETEVEVTNKATYDEMFGGEAGIGETGNWGSNTTYSKMALCEVGTVATVAAGALKITYTRTASYNLNITQIHIVA